MVSPSSTSRRSTHPDLQYLKQAYGKTEVKQLEKDKQEMEVLFKSICGKLDRLSNFNYTPKIKDMEVIVRPNAPAITMEEVLPMVRSR